MLHIKVWILWFGTIVELHTGWIILEHVLFHSKPISYLTHWPQVLFVLVQGCCIIRHSYCDSYHFVAYSTAGL